MKKKIIIAIAAMLMMITGISVGSAAAITSAWTPTGQLQWSSRCLYNGTVDKLDIGTVALTGRYWGCNTWSGSEYRRTAFYMFDNDNANVWGTFYSNWSTATSGSRSVQVFCYPGHWMRFVTYMGRKNTEGGVNSSSPVSNSVTVGVSFLCPTTGGSSGSW